MQTLHIFSGPKKKNEGQTYENKIQAVIKREFKSQDKHLRFNLLAEL